MERTVNAAAAAAAGRHHCQCVWVMRRANTQPRVVHLHSDQWNPTRREKNRPFPMLHLNCVFEENEYVWNQKRRRNNSFVFIFLALFSMLMQRMKREKRINGERVSVSREQNTWNQTSSSSSSSGSSNHPEYAAR